MVFLKIAPWKRVFRFHQRGKLNPRYIGPLRIVEKIGLVAYRLELPLELSQIHNVFHVSMLRKYISDPSHVLETPPIELEKDLSFEVQPVAIVDQEMKQLRSKVFPLIKVLWMSNAIEEMTWEMETFMRNHSLYLLNV